MTPVTELSPVVAYLQHIAATGDPHAVLDEVLSRLPNTQKAALYYDWAGFWARPQQLPPDTRWSSWGALTGRGWGKTRAFSEFVNQEVMDGRAKRIALCAQNKEKCIEVMVEGPSGLLATSPPWHKAQFICDEVVWPNGAKAFVYTPERPNDVYGPEHDLAWLSEFHAWPGMTMMRTFSGIRMGLRLGYARMVWDSNPKEKHAILRLLLSRAERAPDKHIVIRGTTFENKMNMNQEAIAEWVRDYGGTRVGDEMLLGMQFDESDAAMFKQSWIDNNRVERPNRLQRRIICIDPAISMRRGTDSTGIVEMGLGYDGRLYVLADMSERLAWEKWGDIVLERYVAGLCDCIVVERNRGGDACVANLRARGKDFGVTIVVVDDDDTPRNVPGVVFVKEVVGRDSKGTRAAPAGSVVEKGRVGFCDVFPDLEEQLTTFEDGKGMDSPNAYDAFVWGVWELAGLKLGNGLDTRQEAKGIAEAQRQLSQATRVQAHAFGVSGRSMARI